MLSFQDDMDIFLWYLPGVNWHNKSFVRGGAYIRWNWSTNNPNDRPNYDGAIFCGQLMPSRRR